MTDELLVKICQDPRAEIARQVPSAKKLAIKLWYSTGDVGTSAGGRT